MKMKRTFLFFRPGRLIDGDLELVLVKKTPADPVKGYSPSYEFEMRHPKELTAMGTIRLRIDSALKLRYPGHIGYEVKKEFRGHRYAARSCRLIAPFARVHGLTAVWLTVDPKNVPSQRTCNIIGARYMETVRIPKNHEMYAQGARFRRRYRLDLTERKSNTASHGTLASSRPDGAPAASKLASVPPPVSAHPLNQPEIDGRNGEEHVRARCGG